MSHCASGRDAGSFHSQGDTAQTNEDQDEAVEGNRGRDPIADVTEPKQKHNMTSGLSCKRKSDRLLSVYTYALSQIKQ